MTKKPAYEASEEEKNLFLEEVQGARRIRREYAGLLYLNDKKPLLPNEKKEWEKFIRRLMNGSLKDFDIALSTEYVEGKRRYVDAGTMNKLRKGELAVEAAVDLHGLNRREARQKVKEFITSSKKKGKRCILIIHGRGKRSKGGIPILKLNLISWMEASSGIGRHVMAFATARFCDGGPGAVYVLLERESYKQSRS